MESLKPFWIVSRLFSLPCWSAVLAIWALSIASWLCEVEFVQMHLDMLCMLCLSLEYSINYNEQKEKKQTTGTLLERNPPQVKGINLSYLKLGLASLDILVRKTCDDNLMYDGC